MRFLMLTLSLLAGAPALAMSQTVQQELSNPAKVGQGKFTYYFWDVYNATLYAPEGQWKKTGPFALTLEYLRDFEGKKIAQRSIEEMEKQGATDKQQLSVWQEEMASIFPDVKDGDALTGVVTSEGNTRFFYNESLIGEIEDEAFTQRFFDIWLAENTSEPELREKLLGETD